LEAVFLFCARFRSMKKIHIQLPGVILLTSLSFLLFSCSGKKGTPEQVTLNFFDLLYNKHDLEKAELLVTDSSKEKLRNDFKFIEGALQIVEEKNPTHYDYKIAEQKTEIKNDSAFVFVTSSLDTTEMKILLLNINNSWKIDFNYDEQLINAANKDLVNDVLEIMESFVDSVGVQSGTHD
jgi:hypothetical protein